MLAHHRTGGEDWSRLPRQKPAACFHLQICPWYDPECQSVCWHILSNQAAKRWQNVLHFYSRQKFFKKLYIFFSFTANIQIWLLYYFLPKIFPVDPVITLQPGLGWKITKVVTLLLKYYVNIHPLINIIYLCIFLPVSCHLLTISSTN